MKLLGAYFMVSGIVQLALALLAQCADAQIDYRSI
jgi:hypothetical protein